jgi:hypothetical protein
MLAHNYASLLWATKKIAFRASIKTHFFADLTENEIMQIFVFINFNFL